MKGQYNCIEQSNHVRYLAIQEDLFLYILNKWCGHQVARLF